MFVYQKFRLSAKVNNLEITEAKAIEDMAFIRLKIGTSFYGRISENKDRKYYNLLISKSTRRNLPFVCYRLALDIVIRYVEGGLKINGPRKEQYYKVKSGDIVAEMGAYMGHYTVYLSEKVGNTGKVIAIEPMPDNVKYLKNNICKNQCNNVIIIEKGVWHKKDELTIKRESHDYQSASLIMDSPNKESYHIPVDSLDNIVTDCKVSKIDFMIIQLNGIELKALNGLTQLKPLHLAIAARYGNIQKDIAKLLKQRGYKVNVISKDFIYAELLS